MVFSWQELQHMRSDKGWDVPVPPLCERCGYNLIHEQTPQCPQCGANYSWKQLRLAARQKWIKAGRLKHASKDTVMSIICGTAGAVFAVLPRWSDMMDILALCMGLFAVILGYQVISMLSLPREVTEKVLTKRPPFKSALTGMLLGLLAIGLALAL
jgi:ribosomal protein L37E